MWEYKLNKRENGCWAFSILDDNGKTVVSSSKEYSSKESCCLAIEAFKMLCQTDMISCEPSDADINSSIPHEPHIRYGKQKFILEGEPNNIVIIRYPSIRGGFANKYGFRDLFISAPSFFKMIDRYSYFAETTGGIVRPSENEEFPVLIDGDDKDSIINRLVGLLRRHYDVTGLKDDSFFKMTISERDA